MRAVSGIVLRQTCIKCYFATCVAALLFISSAAAATTTTTTLNVVPAGYVTYGQRITLTAAVSPTTATGRVTFYDGITVVGVATVTGGQATLNAWLMDTGKRQLTARYDGNGSYGSSVSSYVPYTVMPNPSGGFKQAAGTPTQVSELDYPQVSVFARGDFNGDGKLDLAFVSYGSNVVDILLGDGSGGFNLSTFTPVDLSGHNILAADFNGDGVDDLAIGDENRGVGIYLGDGTGKFTLSATLPAPCSWMDVADFNGDGNADLMVVNTSGSATVFLGSGSATFTAAAGSPFTPAGNGAGAVGDFNGDGKPDFAIADNSNNKIITYLGDGNGGFVTSSAGPTPVPAHPTGLFAVDVNGDGKVDLIVISSDYDNAEKPTANMSVLIGDGSGGFTAKEKSAPLSYDSPMVIADFNGDGIPDIAFASGYVLLGDGAGNFTPGMGSPLPQGVNGRAIAAGDFNGDGKVDLALVNPIPGITAERVVVALGVDITAVSLTASPNPVLFGHSVTLTANVTPPTATGAVTFYDGVDILGQAAVVSGSAQTSTTALLSGSRSLRAYYSGDSQNSAVFSPVVALTVNINASTIFTAPPSPPPSTGMNGPISIATGDFNGDGNADIAVANYFGNNVMVLLGDGHGRFTPSRGSPVTVGLNPSAIAVGDFDGDGKLDFAVATYGDNHVGVFLNDGTAFFSRNYNFPVGSQPSSIAVADFNRDNIPDLVVTNSSGTDFSILLGDGTGRFTGGNNLQGLVSQPGSVAVGDFNGDGNADAAFAIFSQNYTQVGLGDGLGSFQFTGPFTAGNTPFFVVTADFNRDGKADLALANIFDNTVTVLLGKGDGTFTPSAGSPVAVGLGPGSLAIGDFNADGIPDIAVTDNYDSTLTILLGDGQGRFTQMSGSPFETGLNPVSAAVADFNGDGRPDIVTANYLDNTLSVFLGSGAGFFPITPCRAVDTRPGQGKTGPFGGPPLPGSANRNIPVLSSGCNIPGSAVAYSLNFTAVPFGTLPFLSVWPAGQAYPNVSTLNSTDGSTLANAAIVPAGAGGAITLMAAQTTNLIIDANGYFGPPNGSDLSFYTLTPCRVVDTRSDQGKTGAFGPPSLVPASRNFPILDSSCGVPRNARAYSLNLTAVPQGPLPYLSTWPADQPYPNVSTLNSPDGSYIANAAIVPAAANGDITILSGGKSDLIIDINGYFAPAGGPNALHFYAVVPCRIADTRTSQSFTGPLGPPSLVANTARDFPIAGGKCGVPASAQAYSLNMTAVPQGPLYWLSAWPAGQPFPVVSTLNSPKGTILANAAIVPAGTNGSITVMAGNPTDLIIDVNGYFAP